MRKFDKAYFLLLLPLLHMTVPFVQYRVRCIVCFIMTCIWFILVRKARSHFSRIHQVGKDCALLLFAIVMYYLLPSVYAIFGYGDYIHYDVFSTMLMEGMWVPVFYYSLKWGKINELKFLCVTAMIGTIISGASSFGATIFGGIEGGRALTTNIVKHYSADALDAIEGAVQFGVAGYGGTYVAALMLGPLLCMLKPMQNKKIKVLVICVMIAQLIIVKNSGLGTPVFVAVVSLGLGCIRRITNTNLITWIGGAVMCLGLLVFATNPEIFSGISVLLSVAKNFFPEGSSIYVRLASIIDTLSGDYDTYAFSRYQLQLASLQTFLEHPIVGVGAYHFPHYIYFSGQIGGHSTVCDTLGKMGLIGVVALVFMLCAVIRYMRRLAVLLNVPLVFGVTCIWVVTWVFAAIANPLIAMPAVCLFVLPCLALFSEPTARSM